jgi:hypothetical protein
MDDIQKVYTVSNDDMEKWEHFHKHYAHCVAMVKHMIA